MDESELERCLRYYDLEGYLFATVGPKFRRDGNLNAFDFFSIVIWKANRAKSHVARRLQRARPGKLLADIVTELGMALHSAVDSRSRLAVLIQGYGLRLPVASAISSVLWPDDFSVYDVRVCEALPQFVGIDGITDFDRLWTEYQRYIDAVRQTVPGKLSLRDKDRVLWARSAMAQLRAGLETGFARAK